ncbi:MAG: glycosyltransferase family 4 protein [Sulfolobales archaeon]|nr:glycosyltransferase family 4 protein [Sulfolobales archaeon]
MLKPLIITSPNPFGTGGQVRNYYILKELICKNLIKEGLLIVDSVSNSIIQELKDLGYKIITIKNISNTLEHEQYLVKVLLSKQREILENGEYDLVISQSEHAKYVQVAYVLHKLLKTPWTAILQSTLLLEPFRYRLSPVVTTRTLISLNLLNKTLVHTISEAIPQILSSKGFNLNFWSLLDTPVGLEHEVIDNALKGLSGKHYDLAYMARITWGKGVLNLIYVVHKLKRAGLDVKVLIIGEFSNDTLKERFLGYAKKFNVLENFVFSGFTSGIEKYKLLSSAKVFVYPSKLDIFPISLLEALAVGLPAVVLDAPFANSFGNSVIPVRGCDEMVEVIRTLLSDENLREALGNEARAFSRKFTCEAAARSEYKAYLKTLEWFIKYA